ncbi:hypothetical protein [Allorhodopirellula heiligendammensis]|uniref:Uncharacterized protein n=1 Tax=Allorhodopirellula heiligendammensis TaxID=2714739 RepID=A0A5C6C3C0_9BACT|nr:hypothetical protein [Allorhodopirellula heiligendammensis]TWU18016.1 hypothetical protein Poly21_01690 [Allorhodopirellula heiligendammensis]
MNLYAACRVAEEMCDRGLVVHSIGRFLPPEEVTPFAPFAVAITCPLTGRRTVIRSAEEAGNVPSPSEAAIAARAVTPVDRTPPVPVEAPEEFTGLLF